MMTISKNIKAETFLFSRHPKNSLLSLSPNFITGTSLIPVQGQSVTFFLFLEKSIVLEEDMDNAINYDEEIDALKEEVLQ